MGVQNRTNPIEKSQTNPTQTKTAFGSYVFKSLFDLTARFGYVCGFIILPTEVNITKPQHKRNILKGLG